MLYGFVSEDGEKLTDEDPFEDALYYFGDSDDGAMHQGWLQYMDGSDIEDWYEDLSEMWFYFNPSNGKKVSDNDSKTIDGNKYAFDVNGVMVSGWDDVTTTSTPEKYFNGDTEGWLTRGGWIWAVPAEDIDPDDYDDDQYRWFYAGSNGKVVTDDLKTISGKKYIFNSVGIMKSGLIVLDAADPDTIVDLVDEEETDGTDIMAGSFTNEDGAKATIDGNLYYFGDEETDGSMKTGKNITIELSDDTYTFGFQKNGKAYNGEESNKIYLNGVLVEASSDYRYQAVSTAFESVNGSSTPDDTITEMDSVKTAANELEYDNYVVGTSGTIVKPGKYVKDTDDGYYAVSDVDGAVAYFEDGEFARDFAKDFAEFGAVGYEDTDEDGDDIYVSYEDMNAEDAE